MKNYEENRDLLTKMLYKRNTVEAEVTATGNVTQPIQWSSENRRRLVGGLDKHEVACPAGVRRRGEADEAAPNQYYDSHLGLVYYNYRHYNPRDGRWISRDPIAEQGGLNLYGFVGNGVTHQSDELGLVPEFKFNEDKCTLVLNVKYMWYIDRTFNNNRAKNIQEDIKSSISKIWNQKISGECKGINLRAFYFDKWAAHMNSRFANCGYLVEKTTYLASLFLVMLALCFTTAYAKEMMIDNSSKPKGAFSFTEKLPEVIDLTWNRGMIPDIGELSHSGSSLNILNVAKSCEIEREHELLNEEKCLKWSISYNHNHFSNKMILYVKDNDFFIQINNKIYPCYITIARMYNKKTGILEYGQFDPANLHFKSCNNGDWVAIINYDADGWVANLYFSFKNYRLYYHGFDFTSEMLLPFI